MSRQLPAPGDYRAKANGPIIIYETDSGALCAAIPVVLTNSDVPWSGKHTVTLASRDGTIQTKNIENLKKVFGWNGQDPFWLAFEDDGATPRNFSETEFELADCKHDDSYIPEG